MSRITVVADSATGSVMLSERVGVADFDSKHFRAQLLERVSWALGDAHVAEQADPRDVRLLLHRRRYDVLQLHGARRPHGVWRPG